MGVHLTSSLDVRGLRKIRNRVAVAALSFISEVTV